MASTRHRYYGGSTSYFEFDVDTGSVADWKVVSNSNHFISGDNAIYYRRQLEPNHVSHISPVVKYVPGHRAKVTVARPTIEPIAPDWSNDFSINWDITISDGSYRVQGMRGVISCEVCMRFLNYVAGKDISFDFSKKWEITFNPVNIVLFGAASVRYLMPTASNQHNNVVRFLVLQAYDCLQAKTREYSLSFQVKGVAVYEGSSDGRIPDQSTMFADMSAVVEDEWGQIVVTDF